MERETNGPEPMDDRWLRRFHPSPSSDVRLVCLPHAGGSASSFFRLSAALSPRVEVLAVQYPGRQDRRTEPCIDDIDKLADCVAAALEGQAPGRLALFGHSMGATVAFEVARRLEATGTPLVGLFPSGRRAPSRHRSEDVHKRGPEAMVAELAALSGTDAQLLDDQEVLAMILPALLSDYKAIETYRSSPDARVTCPITAFVGNSDSRASVDEVRGWGEHTTNHFELRMFPGGHFYLTEQHEDLAGAISDCLTLPSA